MRKLTAAVVMWSLALLTLAVWPADSQQRPPRQQNGGGGSVRPPAKRTGSQPIPPAPTPPPRSGAQQPPATTPPATSPPATSPPATSPPVAAPPVTCSGVSVTHSNGLGQNYCANTPLATPGNAATYSTTLATQAATMWPQTGLIWAGTCTTPADRAVMKQTTNSCATWMYGGPSAGRVYLNTTNANCYCPQASDPTWN